MVVRSERPPKKTLARRLLRFRLSTLLLVTLLVAAWLAVKLYRVPVTPKNLDRLQPLATIETNAWEIRWNPDRSQFALVGWETPVDIHESVTLFRIRTACANKKVIHFAFSTDPYVTAFCENGRSVEIADARREATLVLDARNSQPQMQFGPDGQFLATGGYGTAAYIWSVSDGSLIQTLNMGTNAGGLTVVFSPDGKLVAVGNRNAATRLFDAETGDLLHVLNKDMSHGLAFHPNGETLAIGYVDGSICLWDVSSGRQKAYVKTEAEEIYRVNWSPTGELLVSCGLRHDIVVWDGADLTKLRSLPAPEWVIGASFSPDGARLITAGGDQAGKRREVNVWGVPLLGRLLP